MAVRNVATCVGVGKISFVSVFGWLVAEWVSPWPPNSTAMFASGFHGEFLCFFFTISEEFRTSGVYSRGVKTVRGFHSSQCPNTLLPPPPVLVVGAVRCRFFFLVLCRS